MNYLLSICFLFFCACSTKVTITSSNQYANKRIAIGDITIGPLYKINQPKTDTLCACIGSSLGSAMLPFFQAAGMHVIDLPQKNLLENIHVADSLKIDYLLLATGQVQIYGKPGRDSYFMRTLSVKIVDTKSLEVTATGNFEGPSVYPAGAAKRIGKRFAKSIKK